MLGLQMSYIVKAISSVFKRETMINPIQLLLISIAFRNVISEICVTSNFEENFDEQFSNEFGICVTNYAQATGDWSWGNYSSTSVEPPHPSSSLFIAPSSVMSCTSSFNFSMTSGGTFELYVYMDASAMTDQLLLFINEVIEGGDDIRVGQQQLLPFLPDYQNGWHTLEVTLEGTGTYEGYITLLAAAANQSTLIVDAFRYIPPSLDVNDNNNDCNIYAQELESEEITDENESEEDNSNESGEIDNSEGISEESVDGSGENESEEDAEESIEGSGEDESEEDTEESSDGSGEDESEEDAEESIDESGENESEEDAEESVDESGGNESEEDAEESIDESSEDESEEDAEESIDESGENESEEDAEESIDENGEDESDENAGEDSEYETEEDSEEDTNSTINPVTLTSPTLPGTQSTTSETNTEIMTTLTTEPILVTEPNNSDEDDSTEDNNTEQPEIQPITDNSFWNPFTIAMVVILSLIALAVLGFCCYEFGKSRAQDKLPLMYNDIEVPVSMIVPRVTKVYPDTRVMSFD